MNFMNIFNIIFPVNIDPRVVSWPLVDSTSIIIISLIYFAFLYFVPKYMKKRPAYSLNTYIRCYNVFQIITNSIIVYMFIDAGCLKDMFIYCEPISYNMDPNSIQIAETAWWVMILKIIDLTETGVFILRKKTRQLSVLHIYHHISTAFLAWTGVRYYASGMSIFIPLLNCTVHIFMYGYYFLSSLSSKMQKLIHPYKFILTLIQIVQLILLILHILQSLRPNCFFPKSPALIYMFNIMINLLLFFNFYQKNYKISKGKNN